MHPEDDRNMVFRVLFLCCCQTVKVEKRGATEYEGSTKKRRNCRSKL